MTPASAAPLMQPRNSTTSRPVAGDRGARKLLHAAPRCAQSRRAIWVGGCGDSLFGRRPIDAPCPPRSAATSARPLAAECSGTRHVGTGDTVVGISLSGSTRRTYRGASSALTEERGPFAITINADPHGAGGCRHARDFPNTPCRASPRARLPLPCSPSALLREVYAPPSRAPLFAERTARTLRKAAPDRGTV